MYNCKHSRKLLCQQGDEDSINYLTIFASMIMNKAKEKDSKLSPPQTILILYQMEYLDYTYLFTLGQASTNECLNV